MGLYYGRFMTEVLSHLKREIMQIAFKGEQLVALRIHIDYTVDEWLLRVSPHGDFVHPFSVRGFHHLTREGVVHLVKGAGIPSTPCSKSVVGIPDMVEWFGHAFPCIGLPHDRADLYHFL